MALPLFLPYLLLFFLAAALYLVFQKSKEAELLRKDLAHLQEYREKEREDFDETVLERDSLRESLNDLLEKKACLEEKVRAALLLEEDSRRKDEELSTLRHESKSLFSELSATKKALENERSFNIEKLKIIEEAKASLKESFRSLSQEALKMSSESFLQLAETRFEKLQETAKGALQVKEQAFIELVKPIKESLKEVDGVVKEMEKSRASAYASLTEQVKNLLEVQKKLETETASLVHSLRIPATRGNWGEIQLKRVVEMAGMIEYCDFVEQETLIADGNRLRPDMLVKLPGDKIVIIDSKAPLQAFLESQDAKSEEEREEKLKMHAKQVRSRILQLSSKAYWEQFEKAPEFVVLFLPGETFFSTALKFDPALIEQAISEKVILASPTTLIALLKAIAYGWSQEKIAKNAEEIARLGGEMLYRFNTVLTHFDGIRRGLESSVQAYNNTVGSFETRLIPQARRFHELAPNQTSALVEIKPVEKFPREILIKAEDALVPDSLSSLS